MEVEVEVGKFLHISVSCSEGEHLTKTERRHAQREARRVRASGVRNDGSQAILSLSLRMKEIGVPAVRSPVATHGSAEGNEDLSLEIVERREATGGQPGFADILSLSSDEDAVVELGEAGPRRKDKKKKRRKERRKKQRKEDGEAVAAAHQGRSVITNTPV